MPETMVGVLCVATGGAVLLVLLVDVFLTAFHAEGRGGPLTRRLNRVLWRALRRLGTTGAGDTRPRILALGGSLHAVATIVTWGLMLILGFALIYYPYVPSFVSSPPAPGPSWVDALYYSGYAATTLGLGDVVATLPALRLLTVLEALNGFAMLTVAVTYVLAVYREAGKMQALASEIAAYFDAGVDTIAEYARGDAVAQIAAWEERIAASLLQTLEAHWQYPVLHYFRPRDDDRSLPLQLGKLISFLESTGTGGEKEDEAGSRRDEGVHARPSRELLERAVDSYLQNMDRQYVPGAVEDGEDADPRRHQRRLLHHMGYTAHEPPGEPDPGP